MMSNPNSACPSVPCDLCGGAEVAVLGVRSRSGAPLRTVGCRACGLVWSDPRPHDPRRYYVHDYRREYKHSFTPKPKHVLRAGQVALSRWRGIADLAPRRGRVLDVGGGGGEFAHLLQRLGHEVDVLEPNRGYAEFAAREYGLRIAGGFVCDTGLPEGAYDLITAWHVLEHTEAPLDVLARLRRAAAPGACVVIEVPNVEATCQSPRSTFHEAHLYSFNVDTLRTLAARAGLRAERISISDDGGNITAVFRPAPAETAAPGALAGNFERISGILGRHTPLAHLLTAHPYRRFAARLRRTLGERLQTFRHRPPRALLDTLYDAALQPLAPAPVAASPAAPRRRLWPKLVIAYGFAILAEWLILDRVIPMQGWSEAEKLALYLGLQVAVIGAVLWTHLRPRSLRQHLQFAGWASPMLALPAFC